MTKKGWHKEPARHSLAARGLKTRIPKVRCNPSKSTYVNGYDVKKKMTSFKDEIFNLDISSRLSNGQVHFPFDSEDNLWHNEYTVTVKNNENGERTSFKWYGSAKDYEDDVIEMSDFNMKYAVADFFDSAYETYDSSFEDWADTYGYDTDSRNAERMYKGHLSQTKQAKKLFKDSADDWQLLAERMFSAIGER